MAWRSGVRARGQAPCCAGSSQFLVRGADDAATAARRRQEPGLTANATVNERRVLDAVTIALDHGIDIAAIDEKGNTVLHDAASRRLDTVVELLVRRGADLTAQNAEGQTPLALASGRGGDDAENPTVELLRRLGANN